VIALPWTPRRRRRENRLPRGAGMMSAAEANLAPTDLTRASRPRLAATVVGGMVLARAIDTGAVRFAAAPARRYGEFWLGGMSRARSLRSAPLSSSVREL
jgi:hypothetical protein